MILSESKSGWGNNYYMMRFIGNWAAEMATAGQMKFYPGDATKVTDVFFGETWKDIKIVLYPHNKSDMFQFASTKEEEIRKILEEEMMKEGNHRSVFTMILDENPRLLLKEDFSNYYPQIDKVDELFIFDIPQGGFPNVYLYEKSARMSEPNLIHILAQSSSSIMSCASSPTDLGKELVYILFNSKMKREFTTDHPHLDGIKFPTNGNMNFFNIMNHKELDKFADTCGADKIIVKSNGKTSYDAKDIKTLGDDIFEDSFGKPPREELEEIVSKDVAERDSTNLSDVHEIGLKKFIKMVPFTDRIIDIVMDISGVAKKMCLFEGVIHILPIDAEFDFSSFFLEDDDDDIFHVCTEETYPRKFLPAPSKKSVVKSTKEYVQ